MSLIDTINEIAATVTNQFDKEAEFDTAVVVKRSPHTPPVRIYKVAIDNTNRVWIMDNSGNWHQLEATDKNGEMVANSVMQRLKLIIAQRKS